MKASITIGSSVIELEGEPEAISQTILKLNSTRLKRPSRQLKSTLTELFHEGFFIKPKALSEIREKLEERHVAFSQVSLFPALYISFLAKGLLKREGNRGSFRYYCTTRDMAKNK